MAWWLMPRTPDSEVGGSSPTRVKPCCVLEQGAFTPKSTGNTQEAVAPSQHDLKHAHAIYSDFSRCKNSNFSVEMF